MPDTPKQIADVERALLKPCPKPMPSENFSVIALECVIPSGWTDYNGHTNDSRYGQLASEAGDNFLRSIGLDEQYLANIGTFFTVESHTRFLDQTHAGDEVRVELRVLSCDAKRIHVWTEIVREDGVVAATVEYLLLHIDAQSQRSAPMGDDMFTTLSRISASHTKLETPAGVGRRVGEKPTR